MTVSPRLASPVQVIQYLSLLIVGLALSLIAVGIASPAAWDQIGKASLQRSRATEPQSNSIATRVAPKLSDEVLVVLRHKRLGVYYLQRVIVRRDGTVRSHDKVLLPTGWTYGGPVLDSDGSCLVAACSDDGRRIAAFRWRWAAGKIEPVGSTVHHDTGGWGYGLASYSRKLGSCLLAKDGPEGMADPPRVWVPGSRHLLKLGEAHLELGDLAQRWVESAAYSSDGSSLILAVERKNAGGPPADIYLYQLERKALRQLASASRYVWMLSISPDGTLGSFVDTSGTITVIDLRTGKKRQGPSLRAVKAVAENPKGGAALLGIQANAKCPFSWDGEHVYVITASWGLARYDLKSQQWELLSEVAHDPADYPIGVAVVPR